MCNSPYARLAIDNQKKTPTQNDQTDVAPQQNTGLSTVALLPAHEQQDPPPIQRYV